MTRFFLLIILLVGLTSCVTAEGSFKDKGMSSAAFEMSCPAEELEVTVLDERVSGMACFGSKVGVSGCGKKAVYICAEGNTWLNNTGVSQGGQ